MSGTLIHHQLPIQKTVRKKSQIQDSLFHALFEFMWSDIVVYFVRILNENLENQGIEIKQQDDLSPPTIFFIHSSTSPECIQLECKIMWNSNTPLQIRNKRLGRFTPYIAIENIFVETQFRLELSQHMTEPPFFRSCSIQSKKTPEINISVHALHLELCDILKNVICSTCDDVFVYPNEFQFNTTNKKMTWGLHPRSFIGNLNITLYPHSNNDSQKYIFKRHYSFKIIYGNWSYTISKKDILKYKKTIPDIPIFLGNRPNLIIEVWETHTIFRDSLIDRFCLDYHDMGRLINTSSGQILFESTSTSDHWKKALRKIHFTWFSTKEIMENENVVFIDLMKWKCNKKYKNLFLRITEGDFLFDCKLKKPCTLKLNIGKPNTLTFQMGYTKFGAFKKSIKCKSNVELQYASQGSRQNIHSIDFKNSSDKVLMTLLCNIRTCH